MIKKSEKLKLWKKKMSNNQERVVYFNGKIIPESQAKISFRDRGFMLGDAVYDTTRTFGGKIFRLSEHLDRFLNSLKYMRMEPNITKNEWENLTMQVLEQNLHLLKSNDDFWVSQRVSRGDGVKLTSIIECYPLPFKERAKYYKYGIPIITPSVRRTPPESISPRAKIHNNINLIQAEFEAKSTNPDALPILLDTNGNLSEGPGANIFIVKKGTLITPKKQRILEGISREVTIELAKKLSINFSEDDIDLFDLYTANEAFITSTSFCIVPISTSNGNTIGSGEIPGKITNELQNAYTELVGMEFVQQYLSNL